MRFSIQPEPRPEPRILTLTLDESYTGSREVKESVQKRLKRDAIESIQRWQHEKSISHLAEAFGRTVVIPSFFSFSVKKLVGFYHKTAKGISYKLAVPESLMSDQ